MPLITFATLWICLATGGADADAFTRFQDSFERLRTLEARFVQEVQTPLGRESARGMIWIQRPDRLRWEYQEPERKLFFLRKNRYEFYIPADNQLVVQELEPAELDETPLVFVLGGGQRLDRSYSRRLIDQPAGQWRYLLTARQAGSPFPKVFLTLGGEPLFVTELVLHEDSGAVHIYRFSDVRINPKLPADFFDFRPPRGVEIIRQE